MDVIYYKRSWINKKIVPWSVVKRSDILEFFSENVSLEFAYFVHSIYLASLYQKSNVYDVV